MFSKIPIHPAKRIFDVVLSVFAILIFFPLIFLFFIAIIIEHILRLRPFDPLLYAETRFSQGKPFTIYKFNIFRHDIVSSMRMRGEFINTKQLEHNGSLIYIGWVLKQIYLDELPQLFNILKGDMSIVGPRPVNAHVREKLLHEGFLVKEQVRAGLTGYHQQLHKYSGGITQEESDTAYVDYYFAQPWYKIIWFDTLILARTLKVILRAKGV